MATIIEVNGKRHKSDCMCRDCRSVRRHPDIKPVKGTVETPKVRKGDIHGEVQCYMDGCDCVACGDAFRTFQRVRRRERREQQLAGKTTTTALHSVGSPPPQRDSPPQPHQAGANEQSVIDECAKLSASADRPGMVTLAMTLARILDNPNQVALWPTTSRQVTSILNELRGSSKKQARGRLAQVRKMTTNTGTRAG